MSKQQPVDRLSVAEKLFTANRADAIAMVLGISASVVSNKGSMNSTANHYNLHQARDAMNTLEDYTLLEVLAEECGGKFVRDEVGACNKSVLCAIANLQKEIADVAIAIDEASADDDINQRESVAIEQEFFEAQAALNDLKAAYLAKYKQFSSNSEH